MKGNLDLLSGVKEGKSFPLGPTVTPNGVNFSLFSRNCAGVDLLLFNNVDDVEPSSVIPFHPLRNHTYHYWHIFVEGLVSGQLFGYRIKGPSEPWNGHRFDDEKVLLDPYSNIVAVPSGYERSLFCKPGKVNAASMKSAVADMSKYDWEGDKPLRRPFAGTVIYEMHVAGFTKNPNSSVAPEKRGTYAGLIEKIPYLKELGITAVELLPVFQFDPQDAPGGKTNYWGYSPISFFAPHSGYSKTEKHLEILDEFRDMVKALHKAGIEVILDVVFNHTSEGNENGPTCCLRGIDNSIYYILCNDRTWYANFTGTGNTLNANQPIVRRMISDSLHFWVEKMHVDGFRFDLASVLARDEEGKPEVNPPVLWDIETDPVLAGTKLIAEAWDAGGLYQVGSFIGDSWKEWNGRFRDDVRSFIKGDRGKVSDLSKRLTGSPDLYGHELREPEQSINFVACHDGFTLNDLVSYDRKHNDANGENNCDGNNDNFSWNCGEEGPSTNGQIEDLRLRQIKNFHTLTLLSVGAPMILMGDEVRRTQNGNNNCYCHDNELSWFDWNLPVINADLLRFVKMLIEGKLKRDLSQEENTMNLNTLLEKHFGTWHGTKLFHPDWSYDSHSLALTVHSITNRIAIHMMINSWWQALDFEIPVIADDHTYSWKRWIDTSLASPEDIISWSYAPAIAGTLYHVHAYSVVVLISDLFKDG